MQDKHPTGKKEKTSRNYLQSLTVAIATMKDKRKWYYHFRGQMHTNQHIQRNFLSATRDK